MKSYANIESLCAARSQTELFQTSATAEFGRTLALETVVQWLVFQAVKQADRPQAILDDVLSHIDEQKRLVRETMQAVPGCMASSRWDEAESALAGLDEVRASLAAVIEITE